VVCIGLVITALTLGMTATAASGASGLKDLGHGVSADQIKVGIAIIDYDSIAQYIHVARGDQQKTAQIFVDYINSHGGVDGRKIKPYFIKYQPIPGRQPDPLSMCTTWTEDDGVFAVLGVVIDMFSQGEGILCITKKHNTIHIGHELEQPWIDQSPPGLLLTPDTAKENAAKALLALVVKGGQLKGKTVGIITDQDSAGRVKDTVLPALKKANIKTGSEAVLSITGEDTTAAQAQLDSFIAKWKSEKVNAIYMAGLTASSKQFVEKIKAAIPNALLLADSDSTSEQAQDEVAAHVSPNPYEGMLSVTGELAAARWANKSPLLQQCVNIYQKATGTTIPAPGKEPKDKDGNTIELATAVTDFCGELFMFRTIAERVGPDLTIPNWQKTVNGFGKIDIVPTKVASLCKGKYTADDALGLVSFDSKIGDSGDWKALTPVQDFSNGVCTKSAKS